MFSSEEGRSIFVETVCNILQDFTASQTGKQLNFYRGANLKSYFCDMYLFFPLLTFLLKTQKVSL